MKKSICENLCSSVDKISASRPPRALAGAMIILGSQVPGAQSAKTCMTPLECFDKYFL